MIMRNLSCSYPLFAWFRTVLILVATCSVGSSFGFAPEYVHQPGSKLLATMGFKVTTKAEDERWIVEVVFDKRSKVQPDDNKVAVIIDDSYGSPIYQSDHVLSSFVAYTTDDEDSDKWPKRHGFRFYATAEVLLKCKLHFWLSPKRGAPKEASSGYHIVYLKDFVGKDIKSSK